MFDKEIICTKCNARVKRYDSKNSGSIDYKTYRWCPYCGSKVEHKPWSPDI